MTSRSRPLLRSMLVPVIFVLATHGAAVAVQDPGATASAASVRSLIDAGRYQDAEDAGRQLVAATQAETGPPSPALVAATDVLVEALLLNGKGAQAETSSRAEWALRARERSLPSDDDGLADSLRNLGNAWIAAGEAGRSIPLLERALAIRERVHGRESPETADALVDLARGQLQIDRYDDARHALDRGSSIRDAIPESTNAASARILEQLARVHQRKAEYEAARPLLERALRIRESIHPGHPDLIETLNLLGLQFWFEGDPLAERDCYIRALAIGERTLRPDHPLLATILNNLATPATVVGDFAEARSLQERALSIAERNYGPSHPVLAEYLNDLANTSLLQGDYSRARVRYERATQIAEKALGPRDLTLATYVYNLSLLDARLGDVLASRRELDRAVRIWQRVLGAEHPYVARAYAALADLLLDKGRVSEARGYLERALRIREQRLGPDHRDVATTMTTLAMALDREGQRTRARELSARAIAIWERSNAPEIPTFAAMLTLHAELQASHGEFESARRYFERALAIRARVVGETHPLYAESLAGLAGALAGLNDPTAAISAALQAEGTGREHLRLTLRYLPERQSLDYAAARPKGLDLAISLSGDGSGANDRVFEALVRGRALVLDEMAARRKAVSDASAPDVAPLWAALVSARQRLANLVVRGPSDQRPQAYAALVEGARLDKERAERALADRSATFRAELARGETGLDAVRAALPAGSALVSFARYDRTPVNPVVVSARSRATVPSYMAFVLRADEAAVSAVPLGSAAAIDALVVRWHGQASAAGLLQARSPADAEQAYRSAGAVLRRRVWDPIAGQVRGARMVFIVPDGSLNLVSFAALPVGQAQYVIDNGPTLHYLSSERDLVNVPAPTGLNRGLLALGGAAFDDATLFALPARRPGQAVSRSRATRDPAPTRGACGDLQSLQFEPLQATREEIHDVASLWAGSPVQLLENRDANERSFKRAAAAHRVLHLATHGYFLGSGCPPPNAATRGVGGLAARPWSRSSAGLKENPLLLSGLALAGANRRALARGQDEDGILTAEEVASLNLEGVEWAVLSACDTGLGEVKVGEGVFGLRRAFQVAGVHTVIMSLWSVSDEATRPWMRALYQGRLTKHLDTAEAVREASLRVLGARRARGQSTHPFYWAAFVAAGNWR